MDIQQTATWFRMPSPPLISPFSLNCLVLLQSLALLLLTFNTTVHDHPVTEHEHDENNTSCIPSIIWRHNPSFCPSILISSPIADNLWLAQVRAKLPPGVDGWGYSLKGMMSMVVFGGLLITATYWALQRTVVPRVQAGQPKKKKQKSHMSVGESFNFLAKSPYIRDLATLVSNPAMHSCRAQQSC